MMQVNYEGTDVGDTLAEMAKAGRFPYDLSTTTGTTLDLATADGQLDVAKGRAQSGACHQPAATENPGTVCTLVDAEDDETPLQEAPLVVSHTVPSKTRPLELYPESPKSTKKQKVRTQLAVVKGGRLVYWCVRCGYGMHAHMTCTCSMCVKEGKVGAKLILL